MKLHALSLAAALLLSTGAWAQEVKVDNAWARSTVPGQEVSAAYMDLTAAEDTALVGVESPVAEHVELHTMRMEDGVMVMRPVKEIRLAKGKAVSLKPGGLHIMLIGLKAQLKDGDHAPLRLTFKGKDGKEQAREIDAKVRGVEGGAMHHHH